MARRLSARAKALVLAGALVWAGAAGAQRTAPEGGAQAVQTAPAIQGDPAGQADQAYYRRVSACTAVLKQEVLAVKPRAQGGEGAARELLQKLTEQSFALVGTAYKRGLRNPLADQLLAEAEQQLRRQSPSAQRQQLQDCQAEGARTLSAANAIERALVRNRARARVEQLLSPERAS